MTDREHESLIRTSNPNNEPWWFAELNSINRIRGQELFAQFLAATDKVEQLQADLDRFNQKDRLKTAEINTLVKENRELQARAAPETDEMQRLRHIENMALRVASSRREGVVTDKTALDNLDAALEATKPPETPHVVCTTCSECNRRTPADMAKCVQCGAELKATFCAECGLRAPGVHQDWCKEGT
jgi:hypothetical protein